MNLNLPAAPVTEYGGFDLAIGSVFAVRWFKPDHYGRLHAINHRHVWKPGENVAECHKDEGIFFGVPSSFYTSTRVMLSGSFTFGGDADEEPVESKPLSEQAVEARVKVEHLVPMPDCGCGFYAFAESCDDGGYSSGALMGVVECYGRTILGTRGLRCEKARIVAMLTDNEKVRRCYPDVQFFTKKKRRFQRSEPAAQMLAAFDIVQPFMPDPTADPDFWERP